MVAFEQKERFRVKNEQKHKKFKRQFDFAYQRLLPHSNKEVRTLLDFVCLCCGLDSFDQHANELAVQSVHYQKVVLKRGTVSKLAQIKDLQIK